MNRQYLQLTGANRFVERLVVDVVQPPSPHPSRLDDADESASHETGHELAAVLAAHGAGEGAGLALQKAARVDHCSHEELALSLREAEAGQSVDASLGDAVVDVVASGIRASQELLHPARMRS